MNKETDIDFHLLFESTPGLYLVLSPELNIIAASNAYLQATLTKKEEIIDRYFFDIFPDNPDNNTSGVDTMKASIQRVLQNKTADSWAIQRHDVRTPSLEGAVYIEKYWRPTNAPVYDVKGVLKYILHSVEDVTEYVKLKQNGEVDFDKHVRHLDKVNKMLIESNEELEHVVYIASHDLQAPLRAITNYISILNSEYIGKFDEKADKYFHSIGKSAVKMRNLILDLLDYSKVGRNMVIESVDCNEVIKEVVDDLIVPIHETSAEITFDTLPFIQGDEAKLKRLFQNLLSNSIKFHKNDVKPEISISVEESDSEYLFAVKDNGIGIKPEQNDKLFVIFQRLHTEKEYPGTGIGLAICRKIVNLHKGRIWIESKIGEGSTFYFVFPKNLDDMIIA